MLNKFLKADGNFVKLQKAINNNEHISVFGLTANEQTSIFFDEQKTLLFVASSINKAYEYYDALIDLGKTCDIILEPFSPVYNQITSTNNIELYEKLNNLLTNKVQCLVVTSTVLANKLLTPSKVSENNLTLKVNDNYNFKTLSQTLVGLGYRKKDFIEKQGEFSIRGDVLDIYPYLCKPARISFFGNDIEFIKQLDLENLNTDTSLDMLVIKGVNVFELSEQDKNNAILDIKNNIINETTSQYLHDINNNKVQSNWFNIYNSAIKSTLFDYLPHQSIVVFDEPKQVIDTINNFLNEYNNEFAELLNEQKLFKAHKNFYYTTQELFTFRQDLGLVSFGSITADNRVFKPQKVFNIPCATLPSFVSNKNLLSFIVKQYYAQQYTIIIYCGSIEFANTLAQTFEKEGLAVNVVDSRVNIQLQSINLVAKTDNQTFGILEEKLIVIGTNKLLKTKAKTQEVAEQKDNLLKIVPNVNDFVVHNTHGIGKCVELTTINFNNVLKDYVVIEYARGDKLFLPVEQLDNIAKYVGSDKEPTLNKLGGTDFFKAKQKAKNELKEVAQELIVLYANREKQQGIMYPKDDDMQQSFENEFMYTETPDQLKAINDVKKDMESAKIMDRLVCGDVGYGKTEVALRAIFKAVLGGYQVAVLCPTTILSQQHYNTILTRMQSFGVTVAVLNRFKSAGQQKEIVNQIAVGEVNVVVGTHRLLSNDVKFKKIGLLVLDEEQRFGVKDKEKIKLLKQNIDVLTLSATPIPRSLHMSLIGVRDISIIDTPPPLKMAVITHVLEYNEHLVKGAIEKELERGGQTLIVFNNIEHIYNFYTKVKALVPATCKVSVAHGQMSEVELENEILNLYNGYTNVLISTTLIENGIDLPTANTLIVVNSDMLGLSQLYQLKGRVGRSTIQAYAYFTYDAKKMLNEQALKRLQAIAEYTELGDGYKIALRDLEIRGAGSIFGHKQHGHLQKVGYAMYVKLLNEALSELKGEKVEMVYDVKIDTEFSATLPHYYVNDTLPRLKVYSEIAKISDDTMLNALLEKMTNIYGEVPSEVVNLCFVAYIKNVAKKLPLKRIHLKKKETMFYLENVTDELLNNIIKTTKTNKNIFVINNQNLPILTLNNTKIDEQNFYDIIRLLRALA